MKTSGIIFLLVALCLILCPVDVYAQFKEAAFTQSYNDHKNDSLHVNKDTTAKMLDFKEIGGGLTHKREMRIGTMFGLSLFLPGVSQIYNREYWKLPIFYGGMITGLTTGIIYTQKYNETYNPTDQQIGIWSFVGAGLFYYASLMDGVASYKTNRKPHPGRATIYSILLPGLGQAYNGEYWKIPIYVGGIVGSVHFIVTNNTNYIRFRDIYREATAEGYTGPISATQAKYYRDEYRRYRDYSILAAVAFYLLQIIDANVFAYMSNFEVSENVAVKMSPSVIMPPENYFASNANPVAPAAGMSVGLKF